MSDVTPAPSPEPQNTLCKNGWPLSRCCNEPNDCTVAPVVSDYTDEARLLLTSSGKSWSGPSGISGTGDRRVICVDDAAMIMAAELSLLQEQNEGLNKRRVEMVGHTAMVEWRADAAEAEVRSLRAERDALQARIDAALALHYKFWHTEYGVPCFDEFDSPTRSYYACHACKTDWPCATAAALGVGVDPQNGETDG